MKFVFKLTTEDVPDRSDLIDMLRSAAFSLEEDSDVIGAALCDVEGAPSGVWRVKEKD